MISPRRTTGMVTYNRRPRSLWGNVTSALLQPIVFYRAFPASRQWMWVAAIILALYGFSAVNQPADEAVGQNMEVAPPVFSDPGGGMNIQPGIEGGFVPPPDAGMPTDSAQTPNVSRTVMTALLAAGGVVLAWCIQSIILSEVSLINGIRPSFGRNLQIAVWATVPLGLMLLIQQIYFAAGGEAGQMGLSLLLERWAGFATLPGFSRAVLMTLATNFTLFWLWSLVLLYLGGRYVLNGKRTAVLLVVVIWVIISVLVPSLTSPTFTSGDAVVPEQLDTPSETMLPDGSESMLPLETLEPGATDEFSLNSRAESPNSEASIPDAEAPVRSGMGG